MLPILGSKVKHDRENTLDTLCTRSISSLFCSICGEGSVFRYYVLLQIQLCGCFRARLISGFATAAAVDTHCFAPIISGFCTAGTANITSILSAGSVRNVSTRSTEILAMPNILGVWRLRRPSVHRVDNYQAT